MTAKTERPENNMVFNYTSEIFQEFCADEIDYKRVFLQRQFVESFFRSKSETPGDNIQDF